MLSVQVVNNLVVLKSESACVCSFDVVTMRRL